MATKINVNGKLIQRPGVYATVKSGIKNAPAATSYSNILIIDDGIGATFAGGSGINGTLKNGGDAVYSFDNIQDFQAFVKGGELWNLAKPLFQPSNTQAGVSKVYLIKAATTAPATMTFTLTNGSFSLQTKDEGVGANGVLQGSRLTKGYGAKFIADPNNAGLYIFQIFHGTYRGMDSTNGIPWNGLFDSQTNPILIAQSPSISTLEQLATWLRSDATVLAGFNVTITDGTGAIDAADVAGMVAATGGTETYGAGDLDAAILNINNLDFTHILAMKSGADATGTNNTKLFDFVVNSSKYNRLLVVAGGAGKSTFASGSGSSGVTSAYFNSDKVIVVHGTVKKTFRANPNGVNIYSQLYHAAAILGRAVGLEPQIPVTLKSIGIDGLSHQLSDDEQEVAITKGIVTSIYDYELQAFVINMGITSLQSNNYLVNDDGTTYNWALKRIEADLNKGIIINGKKRFFDPNGFGGNRNKTSTEDVQSWLEGYLKTKTVSTQDDNLILKAQNIVATISQDNISVSYEFVGNTEISKIVVTGTLIEG